MWTYTKDKQERYIPVHLLFDEKNLEKYCKGYDTARKLCSKIHEKNKLKNASCYGEGLVALGYAVFHEIKTKKAFVKKIADREYIIKNSSPLEHIQLSERKETYLDLVELHERMKENPGFIPDESWEAIFA